MHDTSPQGFLRQFNKKPWTAADKLADIPGQHAFRHAKDMLGNWVLAERKKGVRYLTPKFIVSLIVEMIDSFQGRVYDLAMGSGGFFVQSERFIEEHGGTIGDIMVFGQESNPSSWRLAAMNMAIRGIDFNFGNEPADTFTGDPHLDLRADFVMARECEHIFVNAT